MREERTSCKAACVAGERGPSDPVLLELGRLVWEAINLEQDVYAICHLIDPRGVPTWGSEQASTRIRQARAASRAV